MTSYFERYPRNDQGRDFLITDNHGCWNEVRTLLHQVEFDRNVDRLFHGGDMVDRGPQSSECLAWIAEPWFFPIAGNHELMAMGIAAGRHDRANYVTNGGKWFLDLPNTLQMDIAALFAALPFAMEIDTPIGKVGIVHAEPLSDWNDVVASLTCFEQLSRTRRSALLETFLWSRACWEKEVIRVIANVDRVYVGHTPLKKWVRRGNLFRRGNLYGIDTGVVFGNRLTCWNLTEDTVIEVPSERRYWDIAARCPIPAP